MYIWRSERGKCQISASIALHLIFETGSPLKLELSDWLSSWPVSSMEPVVSACTVLGLQTHITMHGSFNVGVEELNLCAHDCAVSTLSTDSSSQS